MLGRKVLIFESEKKGAPFISFHFITSENANVENDEDPLKQTMALIDEHKDKLGDGCYLEIVNILREAWSERARYFPHPSTAFPHATSVSDRERTHEPQLVHVKKKDLDLSSELTPAQKFAKDSNTWCPLCDGMTIFRGKFVVPAEYRSLEVEMQQHIARRLGRRYCEIKKVREMLDFAFQSQGANYTQCRDDDLEMCLRCRERIVKWLHEDVEIKIPTNRTLI